ncbi:MAG: glycosyltransferase family 2 protein [Acidobacteria bacterium]|nr:glycosyltransferase family 2 protein [Acidobacteriota bacterium]
MAQRVSPIGGDGIVGGRDQSIHIRYTIFLQPPRVTVVIPTLSADDALWDCVRSLERQTFRHFQTVIVDNSGRGLVRSGPASSAAVLEPPANVGFGAAINLGAREYPSEFVACLNDDAVADPEWLRSLVEALDTFPEAGMAASHIELDEYGRVDSAGLRIAIDGSSKQRTDPGGADECLLPSGCAALYRLDLFTRLGGFDESFFLYCEDTDLGLRARWAGWTCRYVPTARVLHRYSHSAGRASTLKAYLVERNRLRLVWKCFPLRRLILVPVAAATRYFLHLIALLDGQGAAGEFRASGNNPLQLPLFVLRAHFDLLVWLPRLLADRRRIRHSARLTAEEFCVILDRHQISLAEVAAS